MAERREPSEYCSPAKRLKLDSALDGTKTSVEINFQSYSGTSQKVQSDGDGKSSSSAEVLTSGDSGFSDFPGSSFDVQPGSSLPSCSHHNDESMEKQEADDKDEVSSTVSDLSELSGLSDLSGQDWKPVLGPMSWVQKQMQMGTDPREVLSKMGNISNHIPLTLDDTTLWKIIVSVLSEPPRREKLRHVNHLVDVVRLLKGAQKILVLTGAGVSVSCGIPDFRSRDGIYSRLAMDFPDLPDPQAMFDINYFRQDPRPFYKFGREIYPGQFKPSPCHRFIKALERRRKLLRNYTQNIDTLEQVAGIENVIECHGSFATASCTRCRCKVNADAIRQNIMEQKIPRCAKCAENPLPPHEGPVGHDGEEYRELYAQGIMKPDIVFFGEGLPDNFHQAMASDKDECDLLIVIGSSLKVRPVALIPSSIPASVPQILINREPLPHLSFDVELLGDSDVIVNQLCHLLGGDWGAECWLEPLNEVSQLEPRASTTTSSEWRFHRPEEDTLLPGSSSDSGVERSGNVTPAASIARDRHLSIESMQSASDSGIAGGTVRSPEHSMSSGADRDSRHMSVDSASSPSPSHKEDEELAELRACWQPKIRESLAERLPEHSYFFQPPSRYIFPGAEVFYDPDEQDEDDGASSSSSSSSSEDEGEEEEQGDNRSSIEEEDNGYWEEEASNAKSA